MRNRLKAHSEKSLWIVLPNLFMVGTELMKNKKIWNLREKQRMKKIEKSMKGKRVQTVKAQDKHCWTMQRNQTMRRDKTTHGAVRLEDATRVLQRRKLIYSTKLFFNCFVPIFCKYFILLTWRFDFVHKYV